MLDWLIVATLVLGSLFGSALYLDNQDAIARIGAKKPDGWEKLDVPIIMLNKKIKKTQRFYERKYVPQQDIVMLKDGEGIVWEFEKHYIKEPAKEASLGGRPDFIYLIYNENPELLFQEAKETAHKMQIKSLLDEVRNSTTNINNRIYEMGKTYKANKRWLGQEFSNYGIGGGMSGYNDYPLGGLGGRMTPPHDIRSLDEMSDEGSE